MVDFSIVPLYASQGEWLEGKTKGKIPLQNFGTTETSAFLTNAQSRFVIVVLTLRTCALSCSTHLKVISGVPQATHEPARGSVSAQKALTVCFLDRWPQTKCRVTFDTFF